MSTEEKQKPRTPSRKPQDLAELRRRRIREYGAKSLKQRNPLRANLGAEASSLMSMGLRLQQGIEGLLNSSEDVIGELEKVEPAMDMFLKITRQWDRLVQLDQRIGSGKKNGKPAE